MLVRHYSLAECVMGLFMNVAAGEAGGASGAGGGTAAPPAQPTPPPASGAATPTAPPAGITQAQMQAIVDPITQRVQQSVETALAPIRQEQQALNQRLTDLSAPVRQTGLYRGGAPGVRTGEDPLTSRPYQMQRLFGFQTGIYGADTCKIEVEVSQRLRKFYVQQGGMEVESEKSLLVPLGYEMLPVDYMDKDDVVFIQQAFVGSLSGYDPLERQWLARQKSISAEQRQALSQFDDSGLGVFIGPTAAGEMIDMIRAKEFLSRVGCTQLNLPPNGRLRFDRQTGAVTAYWVGEVPSDKTGPVIPASEPKTGTALNLLAKKLACLVKCPNDLLRFASPTVEAFLRMDMAKVMALKMDASCLEGEGSMMSPKGLINFAINKYIASTVGTNGDTFMPEDVALMKAAIEENDFDTEGGSFAWGMRPQMWANLCNRRAAGSASGNGPWLFQTNRSAMGSGVPLLLSNDPVVKTTQISRKRTKGSSSNLSYILAGDWSQFIIARSGVLEFASTNAGDTTFQTDQTWFRCIQHADCGPRYEGAFSMCDNIDMTLPAPAA